MCRFCYLILLILHSLALTQSQHWLKVITNFGQEYSVLANNCHRGMWTNTPIDSGCICVNGMWAISKEFCDEDFEIFYGRGHCFPVNRMIKKFIYLGSEFGTQVSRNDLPYLKKLNPLNSTKCPTTLNDTLQYMIRINSKYPVIASRSGRKSGDEICIPKTSINGSIEISYLRGRNKFQFVKKCPVGIPTTTPFLTLKCGGSWRPNKLNEIRASTSIYPQCSISKFISNDKLEVSIEKATTQLIMTHSPIRKKSKPTTFRTISSRHAETTKKKESYTVKKPLPTSPPHRRRTPTETKQLLWKPVYTKHRDTPQKSKPIRVSGDYDGLDYQSDDPFWSNPDLTNQQHQLVKEQNRRIIKMHLNFLIHRRKYLEINKDEFILLRAAKNIFIQTCKNEQVSKSFVNSLIRLFRYLVYESLEVYPYLEVMDFNEFNRTLTCLKNCFKGQGSIRIEHFKSRINCNSTFKKIFVNGTLYPPQNATIPEKYQFNLQEFDFILESVWKIMSYAQYYCTPYFENNPEDLSSLLLKWQGLISPVLKFRWTKPGGLLAALKLIFPMNDLTKFADVIDTCVTTAFTTYSYPHWFERPFVRKTLKSKAILRRRGRSAFRPPSVPASPPSTPTSTNVGYCLQNYWDPVRKYRATGPKSCIRLISNI